MENIKENAAIIIDEEFKHLMPPLGKEERAQLEASLLEHGCRDAIVLWEGILIDGHNRYELCAKHELPFDTVSVELSSREEALLWIIKNQMARRNLTPMQLVHFRGLHYRTEKKLYTDRSGKNQYGEGNAQNEHFPPGQTTSTQLGSKYNVSQATIRRDAKASEGIDALGEVSSVAKEKVLLHEVRFGKNKLAELAAAPKETVAEIARQIEDGTYGLGDNDETAGPGAAGAGVGDGGTDGNGGAAMRPRDLIVGGMTGELYQETLSIVKSSSAAKARRAFRAYIDMLEGLYAQV